MSANFYHNSEKFFNPNPEKIISLVPSLTEYIADIGYLPQLAGITKFCIHPQGITKTKAIVGGTKNFNFELIDEIKPDLIIANKEENYQEGILRLSRSYPVFLTEMNTVSDAIESMKAIARLLNSSQGLAMCEQIRTDFQGITKVNNISAAYFIWYQPTIAAANDTYIDDVMKIAGFRNAFADLERYPEITLQQIAERKPQLIMLSSEPYPFNEKHIKLFRDAVPEANVIIVDGEMFSWYGSRMLKVPEYLHQLITENDLH